MSRQDRVPHCGGAGDGGAVPGAVPAAGLFSTICLAWSRAAAPARQMEAAPAALLLFMVAGRKNNGGKNGEISHSATSPCAEHRCPAPAPSTSPGPPTLRPWGSGGREGQGSTRGSPRSHGQGDGGRDMRGCAGMREVRAGCPAQPHIPEVWKPARGQGLGWGGCSQTLLLITPHRAGDPLWNPHPEGPTCSSPRDKEQLGP